MAEYRHYAEPHTEWKDFPNNLPPGTRIDSMSRERVPIQAQEGLEIEEFTVSARDEHPIRVRTYRQTGFKELPLFIYIHGGGYVTGGLETDDRYCRLIAAEIPVVVLSIEYRLAPENKFPIGWGDAYDVAKWASQRESQAQLQVSLSKGFLLGGTSAGANFTAGISHFARDEGSLQSPLTGLAFLAPSFCHPDARPTKYLDRILSVDEIDDAPGLTRKSINYFAGQYGAPPEDKRLSPLLFGSHAKLALKAIFSVCGWDPRRDEAILFEQLLKEGGIDTKIKIYAGLPHGFWTTCPDLPVSKQWEQDLIEEVKWLLQ